MTNKILIVDDDQNNLSILNKCLAIKGFEVVLANNGEMCLKQANNTKPDLILLDVMMPGIDGFETCRKLKNNESTQDIPIIFLTANIEPLDKVKGLEIGAVDYITKPFQPVEIIARINKHLTISNLQKQLETKNNQLQDYVYHLGSLATLSKAINEAQNMTQMMDNAMRVTLSVFNCDRAWLLYPCDPNSPNWQVPIEVTKTEYPGANILQTSIPMKSEMSELMKNCLSANGPIAFGINYEHKVPPTTSKRFSVQSQLIIVIHPKIGKPWLFGLHQCSHARIWTENEFKLFLAFKQHISVSLGLSISIEELQKNDKLLFCTNYHNFIGASRQMRTIYQIIDNVATSKASILITGETGTGKELCAEAIYKESKRANKPFLICNCAAIPENLLESHLFGHVKGAFTGAVSEQKGLVSQVDGGTLFLDEIGELPFATQSTLLRFVQTNTFSKVGSHKTEQVDVRLLCATNRNLLMEVKAGRFREDLYYRINTVEIKLPALKKRGQDILLLAKFFLHKIVQEEQKDFHAFTPEAEKELLDYDWPGNVRQLRNTIHNLVILNNGKLITVDMIRTRIDENIPNNITVSLAKNDITTTSNIITVNKFSPFKEMEKEIILKTIEHCNGNIAQAAVLLEISKSYIYKLKKRWKEE